MRSVSPCVGLDFYEKWIKKINKLKKLIHTSASFDEEANFIYRDLIKISRLLAGSREELQKTLEEEGLVFEGDAALYLDLVKKIIVDQSFEIVYDLTTMLIRQKNSSAAKSINWPGVAAKLQRERADRLEAKRKEHEAPPLSLEEHPKRMVRFSDEIPITSLSEDEKKLDPEVDMTLTV